MSKSRTWSDRPVEAVFLLSLVLTIVVGSPRARGSDPLAESELAAGRDPSFESVSSHYPAMKRPQEVVGVKEHRDEFIVLPDGRVTFSPVHLHRRSGRPPMNKQWKKTGHAFFTLSGPDTLAR